MTWTANGIIAAARFFGVVGGVRRNLDKLGFHMRRLEEVPRYNWMGVKTFPIKTILDVGAYNGGFAAEILRPAFPEAHIYSFEPSPTSFSALEQRAAKDARGHTAINFALGEADGTLPFYECVEARPSSSLLRTSEHCKDLFPQVAIQEVRTVTVRRLDDVVAELRPEIEEDILVKMDVQGFEDRVIRGGMNTLKRARACVLEVQLANLYEGQPTFADLARLLEQAGMEYAGNFDQIHDRTGRVAYFDAMFIRW